MRAPEGSPTKAEERRAFLLLAVVLFPVLSVAVVGGYGFLVWMYADRHRPADRLRERQHASRRQPQNRPAAASSASPRTRPATSRASSSAPTRRASPPSSPASQRLEHRRGRA